ncbi:MAG: FeoA family protein [Anaerolineales bacterium]|uniref:FeoA family protein n=1 Tax=Rectinema subterraneum TaxID=2653714 RepID=UPI003C7A91D0
MMSLIFAKEGEEVAVEAIMGGRAAAKRLQEMGIYPGTKLKVIANSNGPLIIGLGNTRIALGKGIASKIVIKDQI